MTSGADCGLSDGRIVKYATQLLLYPPARWRGGSPSAAKAGWGGYPCSEREKVLLPGSDLWSSSPSPPADLGCSRVRPLNRWRQVGNIRLGVGERVEAGTSSIQTRRPFLSARLAEMPPHPTSLARGRPLPATEES